MSVHYDVDANCRLVREQLATMGIPDDASETSKMKLRHPDMLVATARMIMSELNNGSERGEIVGALIENLIDHVISLAVGPEAVKPDLIDTVVEMTRTRFSAVIFEETGRMVTFDLQGEPGGHA